VILDWDQGCCSCKGVADEGRELCSWIHSLRMFWTVFGLYSDRIRTKVT